MQGEISECELIRLNKYPSSPGNISGITGEQDIRFPIRRVYYLFDIPAGESRGGHAHKNLFQIMIAASGAFEISLDDGEKKKTLILTRPDQGLIIVPGIWRELYNFSSGTICLVFASQVYEEEDYIRDYKDFLLYKRA